MIVIVGHGPSIQSGLGSVIDNHTVVRLKHGRTREAIHWGTRIDYLCGRSRYFDKGVVSFWHFADDSHWLNYYREYSTAKPSHGLCAAFLAVEHLNPKELAFIGCDTLLDPEKDFCKWWGRPNGVTHAWGSAHDWRAENKALHSLGINIIDLTQWQSSST